MARALLKQRGMPAVFWGEAVVTAVYILNHSPTKALNGRTPYEAWHGCKPVVSHLRVFSYLVFTKELGHASKLSDRSTPGVLIGYAEGSKAYCILDLVTQCVRTARDVVFNEWRGWAWDKAAEDGSTLMYDDFTIKYVHFERAGGVGSSSSPRVPTPVPEPPSILALAIPAEPHSPAMTPAVTSSSPTPLPPMNPRTPAPPATPLGMTTPTPAHVEHSSVELTTLLSHDEERIDVYHDGKLLRYLMIEDLIGDQPVLELVPHELRCSCTSHAMMASLSLLQKPRDTQHGVPRCSRRWTRLRRTAPGSLLNSLVVTARLPLSGCSS
jgi:hypothetical protein